MSESKKKYSIKANNLILHDKVRVIQQVCMLPFSIIVFSSFFINAWNGKLSLVSGLALLMVLIGVGVVVWSLLKKTFVFKIPIDHIRSLDHSRYNARVIMLELDNGRHRNLWLYRSQNDAMTLLDDLRKVNPAITSNFSIASAQ